MFSLTDLEDKLLRPISAQIIFLLMAMLLSYEWISDAVQYYRIHVVLKKQSFQPVVHLHKANKQSTMQKTLSIPIFGDYIPKALVDLDVKPSGLNLLLVGVVYSPNTQESQAIISIPGSQTQTFSIGNSVPGGAKIKQITPDGVLLEHEGELESLSLPRNELTFKPPSEPLDQGSE